MAKLKYLFYFIVTTVIGVLYYKYTSTPNVEVPLIKAPVGDLAGFAQYTRKGRILHAYKGIPFVHPPIGKLRFKKPVPFEGKAWQGTFQATNEVNKCVQNDISKEKTGVEDCLQLNVYVPRLDKAEKLPVMVWIYGGGLQLGDAGEEFYGPNALLDKDVILVTVNYRVNLFGFFTLGTEEVPGNQGFWDQYEALRWVNKNIEAFGGDSSKVTIFGESAGGWSVSYHLASKKSKGLFQAAIVQSGSLEIAQLKADIDLDVVQYHKEVAESLGCSTLECLQDKSADEIFSKLDVLNYCPISEIVPNPLIFAPIDDSKLTKDPFFHKHPRQIFKDGEFNVVPVMTGEVKNEGIAYLPDFSTKEELLKNFNDNWHQCIAAYAFGRTFLDGTVPEDIKKKVDDITEFYLKDKNERFVPDKNHWKYNNFSRLLNDCGMHYGGELQASQLSKKTKVYNYQFDYVGTFSLLDLAGKPQLEVMKTIIGKKLGLITERVPEPTHGDELWFLFTNMLNGNTAEDQEMMDFMVELWTNFAIFHNPTPKDNSWPAYGFKGATYVVLNNAQISLNTDLDRAKRQNFWKKIMK